MQLTGAQHVGDRRPRLDVATRRASVLFSSVSSETTSRVTPFTSTGWLQCRAVKASAFAGCVFRQRGRLERRRSDR